MATNIEDENSLPLSEFQKLPTTIDFQAIYTDRVKLYVKDKPYIHMGTEFANQYIVGYVNQVYLSQILKDLGSDFLSIIPRLLSPTDSVSNDVSGVTQVLNQPFLNLSGKGVIIGIVDTGIDYTKDAFKFDDGTTKILNIWDQTVDGDRPDDLYFGSTYDSKQINMAIASDDPHSVIPTIDEDGHGTFLASVAASNEKGEYIGAATNANLVVVKLRKARQYYIDRFFVLKDNPNIFESTDFMLGMKYILDISEELNMPVVMCIGLGSNAGVHDGSDKIEEYISFVSQRVGFAFVTAVGNEANAKHYTQGKIQSTRSVDQISINVGEQGASFLSFVLGPGYDKVSVGVTSPSGEVVSRVAFVSGLDITKKLVLENTTISIYYYRDINYDIILSFENATKGIWNIVLYGDYIVNGEYSAYLPITGQVSPSVEFLKPIPEYTVVVPSTALRAIKCGAYNSTNQSLLVSSSWGPTRLLRPAPDFVAPGVAVKGIYPSGYGTMTGTSVAAAQVSGITALLFEWGIVNNNNPAMDSDLIRSFLISGCTRENNLTYPNNQWGYGKVNLYDTFEVIRETSPEFNENL